VTAYAYLRISTQRQEQGVSLDTQRDAIHAGAKARGETIQHEFVDILSGTRDDRPAYQRLLAILQPGDVVLVWRLDRIGRNKAELFRFFEHIKRHRITLISVTQPDLSNELVRDIMSVLAAYESQQLAERVRPNMSRKAEQGYWLGRTPRWYRLSSEGRLEPTEDAGDAQRAFDMFLATRNVELTAVAFNANTCSMRQWLRNRAYLGESHWAGIVVPHAHPAIVSRETFDAVQAILDARKRTKRREPFGPALLTGFLYVKGTERRMYQAKDKRSPRRWYTTPGAEGRLPRYSVDADVADGYAVEQLASIAITAEERTEIERELRAQIREDPAKRRRSSLVRKRDALIREQIATDRMRARGELDAARIARIEQEQQRELAGIDAQLTALPPIPDLAAVKPLLDLRARLDEEVRAAWEQRRIGHLRALVEAFIARVEVEVEPTEGKQGGAAAFWRKHPPRYSIVWNDGVFVRGHQG
jgi:DNA invertase Pin-like site-specific DNA recombinase